MTNQRRIPLDADGMPARKAEGPPEEPSGCECPRLAKEEWDGVESDWSDLTFVRLMTNAVMGVPVGYEGTRKALRKTAEALGATVPVDAMLLNGAGRFRRPVMLEVEGAAEGKGIVRPGGVAFSRLFEAPWGELPKVAERTRKEASAKYGREPDDVWVWYLTCRHCSKERNFETLILVHYRETPE